PAAPAAPAPAPAASPAAPAPAAAPTAAPSPAAAAPAPPPAAASPAAAAPAARTGGRKDIIVATFGDPGVLNPILRADIPGSLIQHHIFDVLARPNYQTRQMEPLAAESWETVDPLTWRIKLREGMMWHKGYGEMTAEDVA